MKKRILHITHGFYPNKGFEVYLKNLINNLPEYNHYVTVFPNKNNDIGLSSKVNVIEISSLNDVKNIVDTFDIKIVNIHWTGAEALNSDAYLLQIKDKEYTAYNNTSKYPDDIDNNPYGYVNIPYLWETYIETGNIINVTYPCLKSVKIKEKIVNPNRPRFIITSHSDFKLPSYLDFPVIDKIISVSKKSMFKQLHVNTQHEVIYNGVPDEIPDNVLQKSIKRKSQDHKKLKAVWVGMLAKYDETIYQVIKENKEINELYDFFYLGTGTLDENPLSNHHFLGEIPHKKVLDFISDCDVFLYPSSIDSFGIALVEAMSLGLMCITSKEVEEVIFNSGLICKSKKDYLNNLLSVSKNKSAKFIYGSKAIDRVKENFVLSKMIESYKKVFDL